MKENRLSAVDGLRGIAILMVISFHIFISNVKFLTWLPDYSQTSLFKFGFLGVELFFLISGFVIYMTIERCENYKVFLIKRWLRLFPAMALISILIYIFANYIAERPNGTPGILDLLPGMLFIEPAILSSVLGTKVDNYEGVLWSIHVEIKYYILFGALYFLNKEKALFRFICIYLAAFAFKVFARFAGNETIWMIEEYVNLSSIHLFGWFCTGMLIYKWYKNKDEKALILSLPLAGFATLTSGELNVVATTICAVFYVGFLAALINQTFTKLFSNRFLVFIGFISYPLYLIHNSVMLTSASAIHKTLPEFVGYWAYAPGLILAIAISYFIAKYYEPFFKRQIRNLMTQKRAFMHTVEPTH